MTTIYCYWPEIQEYRKQKTSYTEYLDFWYERRWRTKKLDALKAAKKHLKKQLRELGKAIGEVAMEIDEVSRKIKKHGYK